VRNLGCDKDIVFIARDGGFVPVNLDISEPTLCELNGEPIIFSPAGESQKEKLRRGFERKFGQGEKE
jgi:hypothetical protein